MLKGAISSTKDRHVTRITCCDWSHTYASRDALEYVTRDAIWVWRRNCTTAPVASLLGNMLIRIAYIAAHLGLTSLSPLVYYSTLMQATKQPDK